ncbi:MAG: Na+/H+ antiporter NhaC [Turicibacter sp.]
MPKKISFTESLTLFLSIIIVLVLGVGFLKVDLQVVLLISLFTTILFTLTKGFSWNSIQAAMSQSITRSFDALLIFILIGATIGVWVLSGTIPTIIYHGLNLLSAKIFLPAGLIICSLTSLATGTSWGTVSTVGIALLGIGDSLGIPSALSAGMIVSGAFFGDKLSPMSDTTNLASAATNTNLYDHIGSMMYTTIPAYLLSLILYTVIGLQYGSQSIDLSQVSLIQETLSSNFNISLLSLLPIVVVIGLSLLKKPAIFSMSAGIIAGILVAITLQSQTISTALMSLNTGYTTPTHIEIVDKLLLRGGIQSMMSTFSLAFIALCLGGILDEMDYLKILVTKILRHIHSVGNLVLLTISSCFLSNAIMGEAYLSIILNANLYKDAYAKNNLETRMLSRTIEEGATLTTGLIPWTTAGAFIGATLGVSALQYAPYTFFNLLNPIISILFAYFNIFIFRKTAKKSTR